MKNLNSGTSDLFGAAWSALQSFGVDGAVETTADGFTSMLRVSKVDSDDEWVWTALEVRSRDFRQREPTGRFWSAGTDDELSDRQSVLLFDAVPAALGGDLRDKGIQYLDRSGNCYLKAPGLLGRVSLMRVAR